MSLSGFRLPSGLARLGKHRLAVGIVLPEVIMQAIWETRWVSGELLVEALQVRYAAQDGVKHALVARLK